MEVAPTGCHVTLGLFLSLDFKNNSNINPIYFICICVCVSTMELELQAIVAL